MPETYTAEARQIWINVYCAAFARMSGDPTFPAAKVADQARTEAAAAVDGAADFLATE